MWDNVEEKYTFTKETRFVHSVNYSPFLVYLDMKWSSLVCLTLGLIHSK